MATATTARIFQHTELLSLAQRLRRTAGGHMEIDGKEAVCGRCGDRWEFRDRQQLPQWLRQELINRGLQRPCSTSLPTRGACGRSM